LNAAANEVIDRANRKDPVQIRVAIPAADPPDNIMHDSFVQRAGSGAPVLMWNSHDCKS
jgi:hypothetical protein